MGYVYVVLAKDFYFKFDLMYFLQVKIYYDIVIGCFMVYFMEGCGFGDLANFVDVDVFLELFCGCNDFVVGEVFLFFFYC